MNRRDMLILSVFTVVTVIAWIGFELFHIATTSQVTLVQQEAIAPLEATFDQETIQRLRAQQ